MTEQLKTLTDGARNPSSVPSTHTKQPATAYNSNSRRANASGLYIDVYSHAHIHTDIHTLAHIYNNKNKGSINLKLCINIF